MLYHITLYYSTSPTCEILSTSERRWLPQHQTISLSELWVQLCDLGNFTSQDFDIFLRSFCADSSSPQISAILVGHFTGESISLRKTSAKHPQTQRWQISKFWLAKRPSVTRLWHGDDVQRAYAQDGASLERETGGELWRKAAARVSAAP